MPDTAPQTPPSSSETAVLYNKECAVCRFEITQYERYSEDKELTIGFEDLNQTDLNPWGLTQDQAARRLYLRKDGVLLSGVPAFLVLWADMPRYRWLARLVGLPGIRQAACLIYDHVLAPILYHRQRHRYAGAEKSGNEPGRQ
ncbi:thiol-disulfide oxidoreductase DCC family protein [Dinoroseobacter sp. S124A]|uniref:thiol-disulfide oxidoreductase DCC family protein n=1 Tax=Dinoroseobacter sp. S124A TaxID=3415128 RepID=UPI003C7C26D9